MKYLLLFITGVSFGGASAEAEFKRIKSDSTAACEAKVDKNGHEIETCCSGPPTTCCTNNSTANTYSCHTLRLPPHNK